MKKIICSFFISCTALVSNAQVDVTNTGILSIGGSTDTFFVNGNFTNNSLAALTNNGKFYVKQNFTNSQTSWTVGTGEVILNGTGAQLIGSATSSPFYKLTINKSSELASLSSPVTINNTLTLTAGKLSLDNYNMTIENSASISGAGTNTYLVATGSGLLKQPVAALGSKLFPVGTATNYLPATIALTGSSVTDVFSIRVLPVFYKNGSSGTVMLNNVVNCLWLISEAVTGGTDASLTLQWPLALELTGFNRSFSRVAHYTGAAWDYGLTNLPASGSDPYAITRSGITSFSPFGVSMDMAVLPVTGLELAGKNNGNENLISWSTTSETNTAYYSIEASLSGIDFTEIGKADAAGNSSGLHSYNYIHREINNQSYSYRIKQVDVNGSYVYSKVIRIAAAAFRLAALYPNPVKSKTTISFSLKQTSLIMVVISNTSGQVVYSSKQLYNKGEHKAELDLSLLPAASYILQLKDNNGGLQSIRFVKLN